MKHCKSCEFKYPDSVTNCRACGGALIDITGSQHSQALSESSSQCPNPQCQVIFPLTNETKFCPGCGTPLRSISLRPEEDGSPQSVIGQLGANKPQDAKPIARAKRPGSSSTKTEKVPGRESTPNGRLVATGSSHESASIPNELPVTPAIEPEALTNGSIAHLVEPPVEGSSSSTESIRKKSNIPKAVWVIAACVVFFLLLTLAIVSIASNSVEKRLDDAITRGNLFPPPAQNAHDLYDQLKSGGASEETLWRYRERLSPLLTNHPYQLINDLASIGSDEPSVDQWQEAARNLNWAIELKAGDNSVAAKAAYCDGRSAFLQGQGDSALQFWDRAATLDKSWALPINGAGLVYQSRRNYVAAGKFFSKAIELAPNWPHPYENIGNNFYYEKDYSSAKRFYQAALEKAPNWGKPHLHLGAMALELRDYRTAVSEFQAALSPNAKGMKSKEIEAAQRGLEKAQKLSG